MAFLGSRAPYKVSAHVTNPSKRIQTVPAWFLGFHHLASVKRGLAFTELTLPVFGRRPTQHKPYGQGLRNEFSA